MSQRPLSELTDEELLQEAKKVKSSAILNAVLIGFLIGIVFYSVVKKSFSIVMLIPLFIAYSLVNKSKYKRQELENRLIERKLK